MKKIEEGGFHLRMKKHLLIPCVSNLNPTQERGEFPVTMK